MFVKLKQVFINVVMDNKFVGVGKRAYLHVNKYKQFCICFTEKDATMKAFSFKKNLNVYGTKGIDALVYILAEFVIFNNEQ